VEEMALGGLEEIKMNKLFLIPLFLFAVFLSLSFVSAEVEVTYKAFYAELGENGEVIPTNNEVFDFDTLGYVCTSASCVTVGDQVDGLTRASTGSEVTLSYPTTLQNANGYGVWFYKPGYIHWEQNPNWYGTHVVEDVIYIYLLKKQEGWAPIINMNVVNEINPNLPIEIGADVGIDADTYSALENAGPLEYNPSELDDLNVVHTEVTLEISDSSGNVIERKTEILDIPYSDFLPVSFSYDGFGDVGEYTIDLFTDVDDDKILESVRQNAQTEIVVILEGLRDYSFNLINNLALNPVLPEVNEIITFGFNYNSYYVDEFGTSTPLDSDVNVRIFDNDVEISSIDYDLSSSNDFFEFTDSFSNPGTYRVVVTGSPSPVAGSNPPLTSTQEISVLVSRGSNGGGGSGTNSIDEFIIFNDEVPGKFVPVVEHDDSILKLYVNFGDEERSSLFLWLLLLFLLLILLLIIIGFRRG
jgi:hypothetical protein